MGGSADLLDWLLTGQEEGGVFGIRDENQGPVVVVVGFQRRVNKRHQVVINSNNAVANGGREDKQGFVYLENPKPPTFRPRWA